MDYKVCGNCRIKHYENCPQCFGYGVIKMYGELVPVEAYLAYSVNETKHTLPCPTCGSTIKGIPETKRGL